MNAEKCSRKLLAPAVLSVLAMLCVALVGCADADAATGADLTGYGDVNEIEIAPGYSWTYTATFPSDLEEGIVLSFAVNEMDDVATIKGHTLTVSAIPSNMAGNSYNLVLKAYHAESDQTAYQWIRMNVGQPLSVSCADAVSEIIKGTSATFNLKSEGGVGAVTWTATTMADGMKLEGSKVTGTPTKVGENTIVLKATTEKGESKDLTIKFTVYSAIVGGEAEKIVAIGGKDVATKAISNGADLGVTWKADKALPAGLTLNASTGVISGQYTGTEAGSAEITLTGTSAHGPAQTATKKITIQYEPSFAISGGNDKVLTYTGNTVDKTVGLAVKPSTTSAITWSIPATTGITISDKGVLTITGSAAVTADGKIVVTATSANGQVATKTISYVVEDTLHITGASKLVGKQGILNSAAFTITGGSVNTVAISENTYGDALTFADGKLSVNSPSAHASEKITLTVTSAAGQTATIDVDVVVYSSIGFTSGPSATGVLTYVSG